MPNVLALCRFGHILYANTIGEMFPVTEVASEKYIREEAKQTINGFNLVISFRLNRRMVNLKLIFL